MYVSVQPLSDHADRFSHRKRCQNRTDPESVKVSEKEKGVI